MPERMGFFDMRITRKVFADLAIWMVVFGLAADILFPFFLLLTGIPFELVMRPWFFVIYITAGLLIGAGNIWLVKIVVGRRLSLLAGKMNFVKTNILEIAKHGSMEHCTPEKCFIEEDSNDEIGESAHAFNRLVQTLADSFGDIFAVRAFTEMLTSQLSLEKLAGDAIEQLVQHTNAQAGAILIEENGEFKISSSIGIREPERLSENGYIKRAFETKIIKRLPLPSGVLVDGILAEFRPKETLLVPIIYEEAAIGVVVLASSSGFISEEINRLEFFRPGLALALHNALIHGRLERLAALDPLTGLFNLRFGITRFHEEYSRAVRANTPLGVMMFDIDHFKQVNDTYGHLVGDRVLMMVTKVARLALREGDIFIRYGGEEFLAVLPLASRDDVQNIAERMRHLVEDAVVREGGSEIRVTVSVGGTSYPEFDVKNEADLIKAVIKAVDQALYIAKDAGRNRVIIL